jgi:nucleoside-diphosphate-sugar epimerase
MHMTTDKTALVLGATGGIGGAIAAALMRHGWTVRALARDRAKAASDWTGSTQPIWIVGDAMNEADVVDAASGVSAIVHAVNPPGYRHWNRLVLPMIRNSITAARAASGARIVLPGTLYNYDARKVRVVDETTPQTATSRKGKIRIQLEQMLKDAAPEVPSLILRAGDFFGPGARQSWFSQGLVTPGARVKRILNPAVGAGHSWAFLPDLAETFALLMDAADRLDVFERVQFAGHFDATGAEMTNAICHAIGRKVPVWAFPWWVMRLLAPFGGFPREVVEVAPYWRHPMRLDNQRLLTILGKEQHTALDEAVSETLVALHCLG